MKMDVRKVKIMFAFFLRMIALALMIAILVTVFWPETESFLGNAKAAEGEQIAKQSVQAPPLATENPNAKLIALTFDDGPEPGVTKQILDTLEKYNSQATFFVIGRQVKKGAEDLQRAVSLGCEIGNHTWEHPSMTKLTGKKLKQTLQRTVDAVKQYTNFDVTLVRPTYGNVNRKVKKDVGYPMIYWDVDTEDWKSRNAKKIRREVIGKVQDGDIVLMHDIYSSTAEAVEKIVPELIKEGFELVTVGELMRRKGITLKAGHVYYSGK